MNPRNHLLALSTEALPLSQAFKTMAELNGLNNLQQVLDFGIHQLPSLPCSNYRVQQEVLEFLDNNGLLYLVEDFGE
jgi:hypothetical protein